MDSIFGKDPAEYWVKVVYDSGREEVIEKLRLNEAYALESQKLQEQQRQHKSWQFKRLKEHISQVLSGRK